MVEQFMSIRSVARTGLVSEARLRQMVAAGKLSGFYVGSKFIVHVPELISLLEEASADHRNIRA